MEVYTLEAHTGRLRPFHFALLISRFMKSCMEGRSVRYTNDQHSGGGPMFVNCDGVLVNTAMRNRLVERCFSQLHNVLVMA